MICPNYEMTVYEMSLIKCLMKCLSIKRLFLKCLHIKFLPFKCLLMKCSNTDN